MNVLFVSKHEPWALGGLEAYLRCMATGLREDGHHAHFLYLPLNGGADTSKGKAGDFASSGQIRLGQAAKKVCFSMASRPGLHPFLELGIGAFFLPSIRRSLTFPIDAIHFVGTGWDLSGFAALKLARRLEVPFTIWPAVHPGSWGDDVIDLRLYRQADTVFCQTTTEADYLVRKGLERGCIAICGLPPSVSTNGNAAAFRERLVVGNCPAVFFMGRRDEGKGYPALLKAWPLVLARIPDAILLLAGKGGEDSEHLLRALPTESIRDLGIVDDATKADALAACDVFCLPSAHESFGIVYVEAWSYAKPVICGTAPACRELVEEGVTGLHATQDPEDLALKLIGLMCNPQQARQMGAAGLSLQRKRFTRDEMVKAHLAAWNREGSARVNMTTKLS